MEQGERWLSLAIFFSFYRINFRGRCDSRESRLPLIKIIYFPTALFSDYDRMDDVDEHQRAQKYGEPSVQFLPYCGLHPPAEE